MYAAGKIPGSFFKREGRAGEKAHADRAPDRPPDPAAVPQGLAVRDPARRDPDLGRPRAPLRHPRDERRLRGADDLRHPVPDAGRRGPDRQDRRQLRRQPERGGPGRQHRPRPDRGRDRRGDPDGRGGGERGPRGGDPRRARHRPEEIKKLCAAQRELAEKAGKPKTEVQVPEVDPELYEQIKASHGAALDAATQVEDKLERQDASKAVEEQVLEQYAGDPEAATYAEYRAKAQLAFDKLEKTMIRERIAVQKKRPDGRTADEIRPISIEVGVAPRTHGSALFTRGQTQALSVVALGTTREEMRLGHARARDRQALLPPLQLPAVLGRGGRLHARPQAPRHRPRRARRAGARADDPEPGGVPVHDPRRLGHPRVERLELDGLGVRLDAVADGRRRPDQEGRSPGSRWA